MMFPTPCGFPSLLVIAAMFCSAGALGTLQSALIVTGLVLCSIGCTLAMSFLLSRTVLKGEPSSYVLELPPYRRPQLGRILVRSLTERIGKVLWRAVIVAAPMNLLIWLLANIQLHGTALLQYAADALAPLGELLGLDGVLLLAFILGLPANEIILPVALTGYTGASVLTDYASAGELHSLLAQHGWNSVTAVCFLVFMLFHAPCATTLLTIRKETGSTRCMLLGWLLPLAVGGTLCILLHGVLTAVGAA